MHKKIFALLVFLGFAFYLFAQKPAKKALSTNDFASWNIIPSKQISNNGKYAVYEQNPLKGDGQLFIKQGSNSKAIPRAYKAQIGSNNDFVVFNIKQPVDTLRKATKEKVEKDKMPKDSLGIYRLKHDELLTFANPKSFAVAQENASWIAFVLEAAEEKPDTTQKEKKEKQPGDDLFLYDVQKGDTLKLNNITEYTWA